MVQQVYSISTSSGRRTVVLHRPKDATSSGNSVGIYPLTSICIIFTKLTIFSYYNFNFCLSFSEHKKHRTLVRNRPSTVGDGNGGVARWARWRGQCACRSPEPPRQFQGAYHHVGPIGIEDFRAHGEEPHFQEPVSPKHHQPKRSGITTIAPHAQEQ